MQLLHQGERKQALARHYRRAICLLMWERIHVTQGDVTIPTDAWG
jgi:hypothetical protein